MMNVKSTMFKSKTVSNLFFNLFYSFFPQKTQLFFQFTDLKFKLFKIILKFGHTSFSFSSNSC